MPTQEAFLTVILVAIVINLIVAIGLLVGPRFRGRRHDRDESAEITHGMLTRTQSLGGVNASGGTSPTSLGRGSMTAMPAAEASGEDHPADVGVEEREPTDRIAADVEPDEPAPTDAVTGFDGPATWSKRLTEENARVQRYGRPATVVFVELAGLDRLAERLGPATAERLIPPIATTMRRHARSADSLARLGPTRFGALLPDTDEVKAINYIERVRSACDVWLEAGAVSLRLSIGWAEMSVNQPVDPAVLAAERRLNQERQRFRGGEVREADDEHDVVAAQMRPARAN